ncbi:MAG: cyclopropane-fatty-acyl-phospholipid synthase family protein [Mycobacterium sp.]
MTTAARLADLIREVSGTALPVRLRAWDGTEAGPRDAPVLIIRNRWALRRMLWAPGELGLARAYVAGDVDVEGELADGFRRAWQASRSRSSSRLKLSTVDRIRVVSTGTRLGALGLPPKPPAAEAKTTGRRPELSNDFYALLLDSHLAYSSAYFTEDGQSLHDAQTAKLELICHKLGLQQGMRLLDVGCGWGSLALYAAEHHGVHATGITLSEEQRTFITVRAAERGLDALVDVRVQDYRELGELPDMAGTFDAVSSIEMGEHVGDAHYGTYAAIMCRALKPRGRLLLQQMSRSLDAAPGGGAFIERYIAPDLHLRPLWQTLRYLQEAGLEIRGVEAMREHYVRTVDAWLETYQTHHEQFVSLVGEEVARVWQLYLVGGRLAFEEARMGVDQVLAVKTTASGASGLGLLAQR